MKIINPLYDKAFKYLMMNNRLAKKVLGVILEEEILELSLSEQETILPDEKRGLTLFRLDFNAVILNSKGEEQQVLIELQKSKYNTDLQRFRTYLGANYLSAKSKTDESGNEHKQIFPIITIYILGYIIHDIPSMAVTVNRHIIDSVSKKTMDIDSFFINHLTHRSHIIQVRRLPEKRQELLEKFLVLFNQAWCTEQKYIIDLQEIPEEFQDVAQYLQGPVVDSDFRRQLEAEEEIDIVFEQQEAKYLSKIREAEEEKQKAEEEKLKAEEEKQTAMTEKQKAMKKLAAKMKKYGEPIDEIMKETGLSEGEIDRL